MENLELISKKYETEISDINEIFERLFKEEVYGVNGNNSKQNGSMQFNVNELTKQLNILMKKIILGRDSLTDELNQMFKSNLDQ